MEDEGTVREPDDVRREDGGEVRIVVGIPPELSGVLRIRPGGPAEDGVAVGTLRPDETARGPPVPLTDTATGEGVIGRNYSYQMNGGTTAFFADAEFKPFAGAGIDGYSLLDYGVEQIDFAKEGFIGGSYITVGLTNGQPIRSMPLPRGTPSWGAEWKQAIGQWYGKSLNIGSHGSNLSYRDCYLDLDPTYRDPKGRPLLRMTFDWKPNDIRMTQFMKRQTEAMAQAMKPDSFSSSYKDENSHYDIRPYQTTHNVGGAIMGSDPTTSAVNRFQQSWDVHNVFISGASAFPQNIQFNPTGVVGALTYWMAEALRSDYLKNPRPLMEG